MNGELATQLMALVDRPTRSWVTNDPVSRVHRYDRPEDQEIAAFFSAMLAYGRVSAFLPVLDTFFDRMDAAGGPAVWIDTFDFHQQRSELDAWVYRFNRVDDLLHVALALRSMRRVHGSLGAAVQLQQPETDLAPALSRWVAMLRGFVVDQAGWDSWVSATRGHRYFLVDPLDGSAAKRLWLLARWMVRPADGVDLGLWSHLKPSRLRIPVDTHVHRIARLTGLLERRTADAKASIELTAVLRTLDPDDPVRFDFALAHLGISDGCSGQACERTCPACPLQRFCRVGVVTVGGGDRC